MRPRDFAIAQQLKAGLLSFDQITRPLPGIRNLARRDSLLEQILESIRRIKYISVLRTHKLSDRRADPNDELFDPLKAAILHQRQEHIDEAFWLVFLLVHFGNNTRAGWRYAREIYGGLNGGFRWDWATVSVNLSGFRDWLNFHQEELKRVGIARGFGNHRKYQSLAAYSPNGTGSAIESYVHWIGPPRTHYELMEQACEQAHRDPHTAFDNLYQSMDAVASFGRMARFDYLTMVSKLGLAPIEPGRTYLQNSTGPLRGARLLFGNEETAALSPTQLDSWLVELDAQIHVGMQVLEDALCNWQKSPDKFKPFRG